MPKKKSKQPKQPEQPSLSPSIHSDSDDLDDLQDGVSDDQSIDDDDEFDLDGSDQEFPQQPPQQLVFSDEEEDSEQDDSEEEEQDSDLEGGAPRREKLTAKKSKKLDEEALLEAADAEAEMIRTNITGLMPNEMGEVDDDMVLPTEEDKEREAVEGADAQTVYGRIRDIVRILGDFQRFKAANRSRSDYTEQLVADIASYYGYTPFLADKLVSMFSPDEVSPKHHKYLLSNTLQSRLSLSLMLTKLRVL